MTQIQTATTGNDHSIIESKPTPAEIIRQGVEAEPMTETIIPFLEETGLGGNKGKLTKGEKLIAYAVVARCKEEVVKVVQANNDKIIALFDAAADRQAKVTVGVAGAVGMGLGKVVSGIGGFLGGDFVPAGSTSKAGGPGASSPATASTLWTRFNKRGYFVFLTLIIGAVVAVWVTKETASWKSAKEAVQSERDSLASQLEEKKGEIAVLQPELACKSDRITQLESDLTYANAEATTLRGQLAELSGKQAVAADAAEWKSKWETASSELAKAQTEAANLKGKAEGSKTNAATFEGLWNEAKKEAKAAGDRAKSLQDKIDELRDEIARLKTRQR